MAAPVGNQNASKKNRLLTDALKRELTQSPEDVTAIARKLIESAKAGEPWAQSLIHERCDGKVPQPVVGSDEEPPVKLERVIRLVKADAGS